jgi:trehalose/maltose hydrolase-like predicted phosphorylase
MNANGRWSTTGSIRQQEGLRETLCTLGNGYFATRGAAPDCRADGTHYPGTYLGGRLQSPDFHRGRA